MAQRLALAAAAGLAAIIVVLLGALGTYVWLGGAQSAAMANRNREAANEAKRNPTGNQAQVPAPLFQDAPAQSAPAQDSQPGDPTNADGYPISSDEAAGIALSRSPGSSLLGQPRLVNLSRTVAYEVLLSRGKVYVDATSGQVLYNGANGGDFQRRRRPRN